MIPLPAEIRRFSRADWGALPPTRERPPLGPLERIVGHHQGAGAIPESLVHALHAARMVQTYHQRAQGWADTGYPYLIGPGCIIEGADPRLQGAHVKGGNRGSLGVCLLGDWSVGPEPGGGLWISYHAALLQVLSWCRRLPDGSLLPLDRIVMHGDIQGAKTACPGEGGRQLLRSCLEAF